MPSRSISQLTSTVVGVKRASGIPVGIPGLGFGVEPPTPQAPIIASVTISGGTLVGDVLSSSISYTQVPVPSATPTYQWDRDGSPISGATSASYTLVEADAGAAITLDVSVTNSEGSDSATSNTINAAALAVPSITGVPTISGTLYEGNTLTATAASVTGNPPPATTWQWERDGTPISGATSVTYTLVSADGNADITVVQTETNSQGSDTAESAASTIEAAPVISGVPTISGTPNLSETLTASAASVTGTPTPTTTWQWERDGAPISGATSSTYTIVEADLGTDVTVVQTETNTSGGQVRSDSAESAATTINTAPSISGVPTIAGTEEVGQTLTATAASASGTPTPTTSWQWQRSADGSTGWADISGATSATYTLVSADENEYVRAVQTETNVNGTDSAASAASGQIQPSAATLPLDGVSGVIGAWSSARKLRTAYAGDAELVRESSGNTETAVGFTGANVLDESALLAHTGANSGFVSALYDQSTAGLDATQATAAAQPRVVNAGTIDKLGTRPAMVFSGGQSVVTAAGGADLSSGFAGLAVLNRPALGSHTIAGCRGLTGFPNSGLRFDVYALSGGALQLVIYAGDGTSSNTQLSAGTALTAGATHLLEWEWDGSLTGGITLRVNGAVVGSGGTGTLAGAPVAAGSGPIGIGASPGSPSFRMAGSIPEIMLFASSTVPAGLAADVATFYGITLA